MRVLVVVLADAEDVAPGARDRRLDRDPVERHLGHHRQPGSRGTVGAVDQRQDAAIRLMGREVEGGDRPALDVDQTHTTLASDRECRNPHVPSPSLS